MKTKTTRQSHRKASRRGEVRARLYPAGRINVNIAKAPCFVLPADAESVEGMAAQIRRAIIDNESDSPEIILAALGLNLTPTKP